MLTVGSYHRAQCLCGYIKLIKVGGSKLANSIESFFPFYCEACGVIEVNVSSGNIECPSCHSVGIAEYGKNPASLSTDSNLVLRNMAYEAKSIGNFCPNCKKFNLIFSKALYKIE